MQMYRTIYSHFSCASARIAAELHEKNGGSRRWSVEIKKMAGFFRGYAQEVMLYIQNQVTRHLHVNSSRIAT
jgi:hypothetical protein